MNKFKNAVLMTNEDQFFDDLSLIDLMEFVKRNANTILGFVLIGGALGLGIAFLLPAQWEARALVRVGQLGNVVNVVNVVNVGNVGNVGSPIEPPSQLVDRIKSTSFQSDVLNRLGLPTQDHDVNAKMFRATFKAKLEKSELISLVLRGASPSIVKLQMSAAINELKETHGKMSAPTINRLQEELAMINLELKTISVESERLRKYLDVAGLQSDKSFSQAALVSSLLLAREGELRDFNERKGALEEKLSPERTFPTDVLGGIEVSSEPVFLKKFLFIVAGLFIGFLLGVFLSVLRVSYSRRNA